MAEPAAPLWIWSDTRPTPEQMERLKAAKAEAGITHLIKPPARAIPGCGRVLSFNGRPDFFCEWAETSWDDPKLGAKMKWATGGVDGRPHTGLEWLQAIDPGISQLPDEEHEEKVRFK